jgi:hypothetical protein
VSALPPAEQIAFRNNREAIAAWLAGERRILMP